MPYLTCVIPVYCCEKYLSAAIESVLEQTFTDFELILIDDGSTDNSGKICDSFQEKDARIRVIHKQNEGVAAARNTGIEAATGQMITFIDADDTIDKKYMSDLIRLAQKTDADIVASGQSLDYPDSSRRESDSDHKCYLFDCKKHLKELIGCSLLRSPQMKHLFPSSFRNGPILTGVCCKIYRTEILKQNRMAFDLNLKIGEDNFFNVQLLPHCKKIAFLDAPYYHYRILNDSAFHSYRGKLNGWPIYFDKIAPYVTKYHVERFFHIKIVTEIIKLLGYQVNDKKQYQKSLQEFIDNRYCKAALKNVHVKDIKGLRTKIAFLLLKCNQLRLALKLY